MTENEPPGERATMPSVAMASDSSIGEDAGWIARLKAGDRDARETLARRFGGRMLAVARRMLRGDDDAADAVQDAFLSAFRAIHQFNGRAQLATWLHRIVVNACLMKLRSSSRRRDVSLDDFLPKFDETGHHTREVSPWAQTGVDGLIERETRQQIRACIDQLPDAYREVLILRDIEELDTQETASLLGIAPGAVKTRLHRARQALRTLLDPYFAAT